MITTIRYIDQSVDWDAFVSSANNGTIFHTRRFLSYHPDERFIDHSLIFKKKGKMISVFSAAEIINNDEKHLVSHPGASVGSFVVPEDLTFSDSLAIVDQLVCHAKENGVAKIRLTQPPTIYSKRFSNYIDFALQKNGFQYVKREVSSVLFLENNLDSTLSKFKQTHRTAVRKAEKSGVLVKQTDDLKAFYSILKQNLSIRHNVNPTHTLEELLKLKELFPDRINLFGAFLEDSMIAGVVNFTANDNVILAFYISHDELHQELRPINLLFYKIFGWAIENNYTIFDFGIFTIDGEPNMGLARFKENFGASGQFRDTLELKL